MSARASLIAEDYLDKGYEKKENEENLPEKHFQGKKWEK